jgi:hypothetical protein
MKILGRNGQEYKYNDFGRPEYYEEIINSMCNRLGINREDVGEIEKVHVGSSDYPTNEIFMSTGIMLFDKQTCTLWTAKENESRLRSFGLL